jgi:hypothetical protein
MLCFGSQLHGPAIQRVQAANAYQEQGVSVAGNWTAQMISLFDSCWIAVCCCKAAACDGWGAVD